MAKTSPHNKKKRTTKKKKSIWDIPIWMCIVFISFGIVLGSVFIFDCLYFDKMIDCEDAISTTAVYESYEYLYSPKGGAVSEVRIYFLDRDALYIDGACYHNEMDEKFSALECGDQVKLLLHPNSEYIWEMSSEYNTVLAFDDAKSRIQFDNIIFSVVIGGFCLLCASMGTISLCIQCRNHKRIQKGIH